MASSSTKIKNKIRSDNAGSKFPYKSSSNNAKSKVNRRSSIGAKNTHKDEGSGVRGESIFWNNESKYIKKISSRNETQRSLENKLDENILQSVSLHMLDSTLTFIQFGRLFNIDLEFN